MQIEALTHALDAIHTALLAGRIDALAALADTITVNEPYLHGASPAQIRAIHDKSARNALCLQSAMKGIRAAQRRVAELHAARTGHATYDQHGQRASLGGAHGTLRQRI